MTKASSNLPLWSTGGVGEHGWADPATGWGGGQVVWRITRSKYRDTAFEGWGAYYNEGRWNPLGTRVVYTASHLSLAALEVLANSSKAAPTPDDLVAVPARLPAGLAVNLLRRSALPDNWNSEPPPEKLKRIGARWLGEGSAPALIVPSALVPREKNLLLNPEHRDFRHIEIGQPEPFSFDSRLWT